MSTTTIRTPQSYWCSYCKHLHRFTSMIGKAHRVTQEQRKP